MCMPGLGLLSCKSWLLGRRLWMVGGGGGGKQAGRQIGGNVRGDTLEASGETVSGGREEMDTYRTRRAIRAQ